MRILVIGGTRFMGPPVVRKLVERGHDVTLFHRGQTEADVPDGVVHLHGDRRALVGHADDLRRLRPDVVLDMFALIEADARALMRVFSGVAGRVVVISSMDVYRAFGLLIGTESGDSEPMPLTEESALRSNLYPYRSEPPRDPGDPQRWRDDYDKILVERVVLGDPDLPGTVLRLPMVYGPGDYQHRLFPYLKRMDDGRPTIPLDERAARWRTARGFVENVAEAIVLATVDDRAAGRIYNVAEPDAMTEADWVRAIGRAAGWRGEVVVLPADAGLRRPLAGANVDQHLVADTGRIRAELGYREPVARDEAIARTVAWERANPPAEIAPDMFDYETEDAALDRARRRQA